MRAIKISLDVILADWPARSCWTSFTGLAFVRRWQATFPSNTWTNASPRSDTSTPNSVPRSVTVAVGVRTVNWGVGDWGLEDDG